MTKKEQYTLGIGIIVVIALVLLTFGNNLKNKFMPQVAKAGDTVSVNYTGTLQDGTKFDSSYDRGEPITFKLGVGQVIAGWDEGIIGMKVGDKKHLVIPPEKAYGPRANGPIPANSTLVFDIELVGIQ
jgi:FKBP-type peptidyl-prolyl cis-trans isomerase